MTSDEYATLMDFLATRFARMDARFDRLEARMDALEARMDALEVRMGGLEVRMGGLEARQDGLEARLTRSEVLWESMRDDLRRVAEGVVAVNERLDRFQAEINARVDDLARGLEGVHVRFDRFAVDFGTVQLDHGARLEVLERWRTSRDARG
jgi:chromosome segregation ATPase